MTGPLETFTSGSGLRVDVAGIERELTALWKEAAGPLDETTRPVTRACLFTLVVWEDRPEARISPRALARVMENLPCRVILAEIDRGIEERPVEAWVSAHCHRPTPGARQICCEQISLRASASSVRHLPGLAAALSVPGLPAYLLVPAEPPFRDAWFRRLAAASNRLIVDSGSLRDARSLGDLAALDAALAPTALGDINWHRLAAWQDLIAGFFDPPHLRACMPSVEAVEITGGAGSEVGGRLLAGWIRAALGGRQIAFAWSLDRGTPEGRIRTAALRAPGGPAPATFIVESDPETEMMIAEVEIRGSCSLPRHVKARARDEVQVLCAELERIGGDPLYERSLRLAASLA